MSRYYGIKLAAHYMTIPSKEAGKPKPGGKIIITASGGGIFPIPAIPQYSASKHALVGLTRAFGRGKATLDANVRINAVCPAIVATKALPPGLVDKLPPDQITPMSTIMRCFHTLADLDDIAQVGWVERGRTGETVEGNVDELIWHAPPARPQAEQGKFVREKGILVVAEAYKERNRQFAIAGEQSGS
jgi:15-hydroxyprostaglandin dehydrogenase (NAD)